MSAAIDLRIFTSLSTDVRLFLFLVGHYVQNHVNGLESLKDELSMITKTKNELEKRLQTTVIEKETIFASLEEALDRIHTLERHVREQDNKLKVSFLIAEFPSNADTINGT